VDINSIVNTSTQFLKAHPDLSCFFIGLWAFLETGLLLGLIFPAEKVLIVGSIMVAKGLISPVNYVVCVTVGTSLGYTATYFMGYFLGEELLSKVLKKFKVKEETLLKVKSFISTKGEISLLFGRFMAVVRALLPLVIGSFEAPFLKFTLFNLAGAIIWATAYLFLGDLIDKSISIIITHKLIASIFILVFAIFYVLWRKYGKDKEDFSGT